MIRLAEAVTRLTLWMSTPVRSTTTTALSTTGASGFYRVFAHIPALVPKLHSPGWRRGGKMTTLLIIVVLLFVLGGGGWGYSRWRG